MKATAFSFNLNQIFISMKHLITFLFILIFNFIEAQDYAKPEIKYDDVNYRETIRTVQFHPAAVAFGFPIIKLGTKEKLQLDFDDLDADFKSFNYTFIHCDFAWKPSDIGVAQYLSGLQNEPITAFAQSFNTTPQYTHYSLNFPNNMMAPTKSGNYLLKIWEDGDEENLVLTRRFVVYEPVVFIQGTVHGATLNSDRNYKQEVDFIINIPDNFNIQNPYTDISVAIVQNQNWDLAITDLQPLYVKSDRLSYEYDDGNVFNGINEFRYIDITNLRAAVNININKIEYDDKKQTHVFLVNDEKRAFKRYTTVTDINGRYITKSSNGSNPNTDADYAYLHFNLQVDDSIPNGDVYVYGAFSNYKCLPENKLKYNAEFKRYLGTTYVKQGYYDYMYAVLKKGSTLPDFTVIEGNRFETENEYAMFIYQRGIGVFYDRCIGVQFFRPNAFGR
jgi:phage terminase large subunit-like protein